MLTSGYIYTNSVTEQQTAKTSNFQSVNTSFMKTLKMNILSLMRTVHYGFMQRRVGAKLWS